MPQIYVISDSSVIEVVRSSQDIILEVVVIEWGTGLFRTDGLSVVGNNEVSNWLSEDGVSGIAQIDAGFLFSGLHVPINLNVSYGDVHIVFSYNEHESGDGFLQVS